MAYLRNVKLLDDSMSSASPRGYIHTTVPELGPPKP